MQSRPVYGWVALLADRRNQIAEAVRSSKYLQIEDIQSFDRSRLPDGRYREDASDTVVIANAKAIINIINSFEKFMPTLLANAQAYGQAEGIMAKLFNGAILIGGALYQRNAIYEFIADIRELIFYTKELKKALISLGEIDYEMMGMIAQIENAMRQQIAPILQVVQQVKLPEGEHDKLNEELTSVRTDLQAIGGTDTTEITIVEYEQKPIRLLIAERLEELQSSIQERLGEKPDSETALYQINSEDDINKNRIKRVANAMEQFSRAFHKIDALLSGKEIYTFSIIRDFGDAFLELQELVDSGLYDDITEGMQGYLREVIRSTTQVIEPIFVQSVKMMETIDCKFGLGGEMENMRDKLNDLCLRYNQFANKIGVERKYEYPYTYEKITVVQQEISLTQRKITQCDDAMTLVSNTKVNEKTTVKDLLNLQAAIRSIYTPRLYEYSWRVDYMIEAKTGLSQLKLDIKMLEQKIQRKENTSADVKKLKKLYGFQYLINENLKKSLNDDSEPSEEFSYQNGSMVSRFIAGSKKYTIDENVRSDAIKHITAYRDGLIREAGRLYKRADEIMVDIPVEEKPIELDRLRKLKQNLSEIDLTSLASFSITKLNDLKNELASMGDDRMNAMVSLLHAVIEERVGLREYREALKIIEHKMKKIKVEIQETVNSIDAINHQKEMLNSSQNDTKTIAVLSTYRELIIKKLDAGEQPDEKAIANVAKYLELSVVEVNRLLDEGKKHWTGRRLYEYPLILKIDEKIQACQSRINEMTSLVEEENKLSIKLQFLRESVGGYQQDEQACQAKIKEAEQLILSSRDLKEVRPYTWNHATEFFEAKREALAVIRDAQIGQFAIPLPAREVVEYDDDFVQRFAAETESEIIARLRADSAIVAGIKNSRSEIIKRLTQIMSDGDAKIIANSNPDNLIGIHVTDSLILRFSKSTLNVLYHADRLARAIENRIAQYEVGGLSNYASIIMSLLQEDKVMLRDLCYSLNEMRRYATQIKAVMPYELDGLYNSISPILEQIKTVTQFSSDVMEVELYEQVNEVHALLLPAQSLEEQRLTDSAVIEEAVKEITILDPVIRGIKTAIEKYYKTQLPDGKCDLRLAGSDDHFKNAIACLNALRRVQSVMSVMAGIAQQEDSFQLKYELIKELISLYQALNKVDTSFLSTMKSEVEKLLQVVHPVLIESSLGAEILESRIGLRKGSLQTKVEQVCLNFETIALKVGVTLNDYFPYHAKRVNAIKSEKSNIEREIHRIEQFSELLESIKIDPAMVCRLPVSKLVLLRDGLNTLGVHEVVPLMDSINHALAQRTGLLSINNRIASDKGDLHKKSAELVDVEKNRLTCVTRIDVASENNNTLLKIKNSLLQSISLSQSDLLWLHANCSGFKKMDFELFCREIFSKDNKLISQINDQIEYNTNTIKELSAEKRGYEKKISTLTKTIVELNESIQSYTSYSQAISRKIDSLAEASDEEIDFRFDLEAKKIEEGFNPVRAGNLTVANVTSALQVAQDYVGVLRQRRGEIDSTLRIYNQQEAIINDNLKHQQIMYFKSLERKNQLTSGRLTSLISTNSTTTSIDNSSDLLRLYISSSDALKRRYEKTLTITSGNNEECAAALATEVAKNTRPIGRFFRRIFKIQTVEDDLYYLARHFKDANNNFVYHADMVKLFQSAREAAIQQSADQKASTSLIADAIGFKSGSEPSSRLTPALDKQSTNTELFNPPSPDVTLPEPTTTDTPRRRPSVSAK